MIHDEQVTPIRSVHGDLRAERLAAQQLSGPPALTPEAVVGRLLAVQAQDARGVRLAVRSRSKDLHAADIDTALTQRRSLLVTWLNRGTLHLTSAQDYWWLHSLTTPQLATGNARRLQQEGVSEKQRDLGIAIILDSVNTDGPQTRAQLRARLDEALVPTAGQAFIHILLAASLRGYIVRGPMIGTEHAFVSVKDWLGSAPEPVERQEALALLARRYLQGHGPANAQDLARWAGLPLSDARRGLEGIADEVALRPDGLLDLAERPATPPLPTPRLLGAFDPLLLGWVSREMFVGAHHQIVTTNGIFRPATLVNGRVVATWSLSGGALTIRALEPISRKVAEELRRDAAQVLNFLDQAARIEFEPSLG